MSKIILLSLFLAILTIFAVSTVVFADSKPVLIDVNVTESSSISVVPTVLNWTATNTGQAGSLKYLNIKNAGSLNVSQIYAYIDTVTTEAIRPYGSGDSRRYSAGGVITLKNETDTQQYFAGRLEWNWTQDIPNHVWSAVASPVAWGYFRNTSQDFVWVVGNGTGGKCNNTGAEFAIEDEEDLGTASTREPDDTGINRVTGDVNYSYFNVTRPAAPLYRYCVAVSQDCSKIFIYHFDKRASFGSCIGSEYLQEANLVPGYTIILSVVPYIPNGIPSGYLNTTTLTVVAT